MRETTERTSAAPRGPAGGLHLNRIALSRADEPPRWGYLYLPLIVVSGLGITAHLLVDQPVIGKVLDINLGGALIGVLWGWAHWNRIDLTRLDDSERRGVEPTVGLIRPRRLHQPVINPYDFR